MFEIPEYDEDPVSTDPRIAHLRPDGAAGFVFPRANRSQIGDPTLRLMVAGCNIATALLFANPLVAMALRMCLDGASAASRYPETRLRSAGPMSIVGAGFALCADH